MSDEGREMPHVVGLCQCGKPDCPSAHGIGLHPRARALGESAPAAPSCQEPVAIALIREAVAGLSKGACLTCGAEPGCNIDCKGCAWIASAERFLSDLPASTAASRVEPCRCEYGASGAHAALCPMAAARVEPPAIERLSLKICQLPKWSVDEIAERPSTYEYVLLDDLEELLVAALKGDPR